MGRPAVLAIFAVLTGCSENEQPPRFGLTWQDEFDGAAGELPDAARWRFDTGTDRGNAQLEYDTDRPANVSLDGEGQSSRSGVCR